MPLNDAQRREIDERYADRRIFVQIVASHGTDLARTVRSALDHAIAAASAGKPINVIGKAVETEARHPSAAYTLGKARAVPFDVATLFPRDTSFEPQEQALLEALGADTLEGLLAQGAGAKTEQALERIVGALRRT